MMVLITTYQYLQRLICVVEQCVTRWSVDLRYDGADHYIPSSVVLITTYQYLQHPICAVEQCVTRWSLDLRYDGGDHCPCQYLQHPKSVPLSSV
ncbi:hypothetical protein RRG08_005381 [Elysia crispata]|uniref:Uncharacterized protein n=1 Tax=Elysia crispata TaxID=231223 RepID=A0AAE0YW82_9GAST|nr:hypothetical protein RRG08_005381 [Elysia crispata]